MAKPIGIGAIGVAETGAKSAGDFILVRMSGSSKAYAAGDPVMGDDFASDTVDPKNATDSMWDDLARSDAQMGMTRGHGIDAYGVDEMWKDQVNAPTQEEKFEALRRKWELLKKAAKP